MGVAFFWVTRSPFERQAPCLILADPLGQALLGISGMKKHTSEPSEPSEPAGWNLLSLPTWIRSMQVPQQAACKICRVRESIGCHRHVEARSSSIMFQILAWFLVSCWCTCYTHDSALNITDTLLPCLIQLQIGFSLSFLTKSLTILVLKSFAWVISRAKLQLPVWVLVDVGMEDELSEKRWFLPKETWPQSCR